VRNITFINTLALCTVMALPADAQSALPQGCYVRDYSAEHLAKNPNQVVDRISVSFRQNAGDKVAQMSVLTADQGHAGADGHGGQLFAQYLYCFAGNGGAKNWTCSVECDGGSMEITRVDGKILEFRTDYLLVGEIDECGGAVDLAEVVGQRVIYRLNRVADSQCVIK